MELGGTGLAWWRNRCVERWMEVEVEERDNVEWEGNYVDA